MHREPGAQRRPWWEVGAGSWNVTVLRGPPINALLTTMMSALQNITGALSLWIAFLLIFSNLKKFFFITRYLQKGKKKQE